MLPRPAIWAFLLLTTAFSEGLRAQDAAPKTHTVATGPFRVVVDLSGVIESESMTEVRLRPKEWSKLVVKKVVPQGTRLAEGDPILWLETEDLEQAIRDAEVAVALAKLALEGGQSEFASLQKSVPLDLEAAERSKKQADEDLEYYTKVGEELSRKSAERMARMSQEQLEYSQEELDQLEKMYKADDLTEETEEIILLRQRREVEHAKFSAEASKKRLDRNLEFEMPRERINMQNGVIRQEISLQRSKATLPASLEQKRLEVVKLEHGLKQAAERAAKLKGDLELMVVKSPVAGIVRYGQCDRGKWTTAAQLEPQMREGGSVMPNQTLFTIVSGDRTFIRVDVPEAQLSQSTPGKTGVAVPAGYSDARLPAKLEAVDLIAVREGVYNGRVTFSAEKTPVIVGMGVTVKLTTYSKEGAISVPASAVFTEESDDTSRYVWMAGDKPEKRTVKAGLTKGDRLEILEGLKADEKILLEKPKE